MEYKKNSKFQVTITDMGTQGEGIGKVEGYTLFVKDAVIGDTVEALITKPKKNYAYARCEKVLVPSPFRVAPPCPLHRKCGGCQLMAMSYEKELELKYKKVKNNLMRLGGFEEDVLKRIMEPAAGMDVPLRYRNKAQYPIGRDKGGRIIAGFYAGRTHSIIPNTDCLLGAKMNEAVLQTVLSFMEENHIEPYDERTGTGLVRHVLIRTGFTTGEIMVCLVVNGEKLEKGNILVKRLIELNETAFRGIGTTDGISSAVSSEVSDVIPSTVSGEMPDVVSSGVTESASDKVLGMISGTASDIMYNQPVEMSPRITSISINVNMENTNVIMGNETKVLYGEPYITDYIGDVAFQISPLSFFQVNPMQTRVLYNTALEYAGLTGNETVWDLYCGIGTISLFLAQKAKQVYGVEIVPQAIEDARRNAALNQIHNAEFFVGKAEEVLPEFYMQHKESEMAHPDVIVADPPRKGCDEACLNTMLAMKPGRIVYVSCDSATLARDLKILCEKDYVLERVKAVDLFGRTVHVECVVLMSRVEK